MASQELTLRTGLKMEHSKLLALPKELRLEIWRYTVTDPSTEHLVLNIDTDFIPCSPQDTPSSKRPCNPLRQYSRFNRTFKTSFPRPRNHSVNIAVLQSNRLVYKEALPLLYHSVKFYPSDAAFTSFLSTLSDFAKTQIRYVKLNIDLPRLKTVELSWSVKCAQVARLPGIRGVEIESGRTRQPRSPNIRKELLWPLLKIRAPKKLVPRGDEELQKLLLHAAERHKAKKKAIREQAVLQDTAKEKDAPQILANTEAPVSITSEKPPEHPLPDTLKRAIAANLRTQDDQAPVEDLEASEWDIVSVQNTSSPTDSAHSGLVVGTKRSRSLSDDEKPLLLGCDDWEVVDLSQTDDDDKFDA